MFLRKSNMSRIEESIFKLKRFKYHAIGRLELEDAIDNVVSWYEQMMKGAVEGKLVDLGSGYQVQFDSELLDAFNIKYGQKFKVIVIKED